MKTKAPTETIRLEYWDGIYWVPCGKPFFNERNAWASLGGDDVDYRTIDSQGNTLTDKRTHKNDSL